MNTPSATCSAVHVPSDWAPDSWRTRPAPQLPVYPDAAALAEVQAELHGLPPLVTSWEILALKQQLADAQEGRRFLLQGGDCAESFADCNSPADLQPAEGAAADEPGAGARAASCRWCASAASPASTPSRVRPTAKRATA